jgi:RHS repeat-associated protein
VKGNWIGASRTCDLSSLPPDQRGKLCEQLAGCSAARAYCGVENSCTVTGSLVDIQNQALGETIHIIGTPFSLHYRSDRIQFGRAGGFLNSLGGWSLDVHHAYEAGRNILSMGDGRQRLIRGEPGKPGKPRPEIHVPSETGLEAYVFDQNGRHLRTIATLNGALRYRFSYDLAGLLGEIEDSFGNITRVVRADKGDPAAIVAASGQRTNFTVNAGGYLESVTNPAGETVRFGYSREGRLMTLTDAKGQVQRFAYSGPGLLLEDKDPAGGGWTLRKQTGGGSVSVELRSMLGRTSTYTLDQLATGHERRVTTGPEGTVVRASKDPDGRRTVSFPDGSTSISEFRPDPRWGANAPVRSRLTLTTPGGVASTWSFDRSLTLATPGDPLSLATLTDAMSVNGGKSTRVFDAKKNQVTHVTPAGRRVVMTVNDAGRMTKLEMPGLLPVELTYENKGHLTAISQGASGERRTVRFNIDGEGRLASIADSLKREVRFEYDQAMRVAKQVLPDGREIAFKWDPNGNLSSLTPPGRPPHEFEYTPVNLLARYRPPEIDPKGGQSEHVFNLDRQLTRVIQAGSEIAFDYDKAGRPQMMSGPRAKYRPTYDKAGRLSSISGPDGILEFQHDGFLPVGVAWSGAVKGAIARTYGNDFRIASIRVNADSPIDFKRDPDGLLTHAGNLVIDRDPASGQPNATRLGRITTAHGYNGFGELDRYSAAFAGKELFALQYEYDALGRLVRKTETIQGQRNRYAFEYDDAGRLAHVTRNGETASRYEYDVNGNRAHYKGRFGESKGVYDQQDRIIAYGNAVFSHNPSGQWSSRTAEGRTTRYHYDEFGNLRGVDLADGTRIEYLIDAANRRIGRKIQGRLAQGFLWQSGLRPAAELDGEGKVVSRFVYADRINVPEYVERGGRTYRIIADRLGSVRVVIDAETGEVAQRMDYDEFGRVLQDTNPGFQPFGFAGGLYDHLTGLVRFGARDYEPSVGRWTAPDPLLFIGGQTNLYVYVENGPVNWTDPYGLLVGPLTQVWGRKVMGQNAQEAAVSGVLADVLVGGPLSLYLSPQFGGALGWGLDLYQVYSGYRALSVGRVVASVAGSKVVFAPSPVVAVAAALIGGVELGLAVNSLYERTFGQSLGEDWADIDIGNSTLGEWYRCLWPGASGCTPAAPPERAECSAGGHPAYPGHARWD